MNPKERIEELTAEELCTKGERLEFETDKQKQLNQKRSEAYRKIKQENIQNSQKD